MSYTVGDYSGTFPGDHKHLEAKSDFSEGYRLSQRRVSMSQKNTAVLSWVVAVFCFVSLPFAQAVTKIGRYAYTAEGGDIVAYAMNPTTGQLKIVQVLAAQNNGIAVVHPSNKFLYVMTGSNSIAGFKIGTNGLLTALAGSPFATTYVGAYIAFTPNGKFGYTETYPGSNVETLSVNTTTGALTSTGSVVSGDEVSDLAITPKGNYLYVPNSGDSTISGFAINSTTGALTPVAGSPFAAGPQCASDWIQPTGKFLYGANFDGSISAYEINSRTGALTQLSGSPFSGPAYAGGFLRGTPNGDFLYDGTSSATGIAAFAINKTTGALSTVPGSPFTAGAVPLSAISDPTSQFLYVEDEGGQAPVLMFSIDSTTGALTQTGAQGLIGASAGWMSFSSGKAVAYTPDFAYVTNSGSNSITELNIAAGGLTVLGTVTDTNGPQASVATQAGTFLYTGNSNGSISEYSIGKTGTLKKLKGSPMTGLMNPVGMAIGPFYNILYAEDPTAEETFDYQINLKTGALTTTYIGGAGGSGPDAIAVDPLGAFTLVVDNASNYVGIGIPGSGFVATAAAGNSPVAISIDPSSQFVYVANSGDGTVSGYSLTLASPYLTPLAGSPWTVGTTPSALVIDPWGQYLYVADSGSKSISAFSIDPLSGELTTISGTFSTSGAPSAVAVSNDGKILYATDKDIGELDQFTINSDGTLTGAGGAGVGTAPTSVTTVGTYK